MDETWRREFWKKALSISFVLLAGLAYFLANRFNDFRFIDIKPAILMFSIDQWIPFSRFFILPYYYWYFYIAFTVLAMFFQKDSRNYYRLVLSMFVGVMICSIVYVIYPTYVPRSELVGNDFLTGMIRRIYSIDPPYNCFPSMHVLYAFICCWYLMIFKRIGWWFDTLNILSFVIISLSTVFTKQHYTPDIIGGIAVGAVACCIFTFARTGRTVRGEKNNSSNLKIDAATASEKDAVPHLEKTTDR